MNKLLSKNPESINNFSIYFEVRRPKKYLDSTNSTNNYKIQAISQLQKMVSAKLLFTNSLSYFFLNGYL